MTNLAAVLALAIAQPDPNQIVDTIKVSGNIELTVKRADKLDVKADPKVEIVYQGNTIAIASRAEDMRSKSPPVTITLPILKKVDISGAVKASLEDVRTERLVVVVSGASQLKASGTVESFGVTTSGAAIVKAKELKSADTDVTLGGAGQVDVFASHKLSATVAGAGVVNYWGEPKVIERNVTGAASLNAR